MEWYEKINKTCYELKCKDCIFKNHSMFCEIARKQENEKVWNVLTKIHEEVTRVLDEVKDEKGKENE